MSPLPPFPTSEFLHLQPPYRTLTAVKDPTRLWAGASLPTGEALVWHLGNGLNGHAFEAARCRPPGVALIVILPAASSVKDPCELLRIVELCQPHSILPNHVQPNPVDLQTILRRAPDELPSDVIDYLAWRGVILDQETRHVVRKTIEQSGQLRTVTALSRSLYSSRRALGRRFLDRGLPVPSHWLNFGRILRACILLQNQRASLFDVACDLGYPDGFALSNQMNRLVGTRPSTARDHLGWEWIVESWMRREALLGSLAIEYSTLFLPGSRESMEPLDAPARPQAKPTRASRSRGSGKRRNAS
jgi:AraC-like DNA-binding protein